jgi:isochorismate pyruvate lyase
VAKVLTAAQAHHLSPEIAEPVWRLLIDRCIAHEFAVYDRTRS